jgi:hypothetical protein
MTGPTTPADIVNRALDAVGRSDIIMGDIEEGTEAAKPALRAYGPCLRQLLRSAHWAFARKQVQMNLLADQTGNTPNVGTMAIPPWTYEYQYPDDCMKARFVPANNANPANNSPPGNYSLPSTPQTTASSIAPANGWRLTPARFLIATDFNYPATVGNQTGTPWWNSAETGPVQRSVVLTNVKNASLVYTALMLYPDEWDSLFSEAMVQFLAARLALPLWAEKDRKFGLTMQAQAIAKAKDAITQARIADGNEGVPTSDISVDWMRIRNAGAGSWWGNGGVGGWEGPGVWWYGYDSCMMPDGAAF